MANHETDQQGAGDEWCRLLTHLRTHLSTKSAPGEDEIPS